MRIHIFPILIRTTLRRSTCRQQLQSFALLRLLVHHIVRKTLPSIQELSSHAVLPSLDGTTLPLPPQTLQLGHLRPRDEILVLPRIALRIHPRFSRPTRDLPTAFTIHCRRRGPRSTDALSGAETLPPCIADRPANIVGTRRRQLFPNHHQLLPFLPLLLHLLDPGLSLIKTRHGSIAPTKIVVAPLLLFLLRFLSQAPSVFFLHQTKRLLENLPVAARVRFVFTQRLRNASVETLVPPSILLLRPVRHPLLQHGVHEHLRQGHAPSVGDITLPPLRAAPALDVTPNYLLTFPPIEFQNQVPHTQKPIQGRVASARVHKWLFKHGAAPPAHITIKAS